MATTKKKTEDTTATATVAEKAKKTAAKVKESPAVKKAAKATSTAAKKATGTAKKAAASTKKAAEKATTKVNTYVEFAGKQIATEELADKVREAYKAEGNKARIKSIEIYVKPEENAAYYVINGNAEGKKIDL